MKKLNKENIDVCTGEINPINAKLQGEVFQQLEHFTTRRRYFQLIKKVTYRVQIEYYPEVKGDD